MKVNLQIQDAEVRRAIDGMTVGQMRSSLRAGLRKSMSPVRAAVVRAYKALYPGNAWKLMAVKTYKKGLGVWLGLWKPNPSPEEVQSLIAMRSLNRGTDKRATRMGYARGSLAGSQFFDAAISAIPNAERQVRQEVEAAIIKKARKEGLV